MSTSLIKDTVAVAESLTGGLVADVFVSKKGASEFFKGGVTAYSLASKRDILNISPNLLQMTNGVSKEICECMAKNVTLLFGSWYGIATTGYAEEGKDEFRISEKRYAYVSLYSLERDDQYTTIVLGRDGDTRNAFRRHVTEVAEFLWINRRGT